jgi:hypothetical protein
MLSNSIMSAAHPQPPPPHQQPDATDIATNVQWLLSKTQITNDTVALVAPSTATINDDGGIADSQIDTSCISLERTSMCDATVATNNCSNVPIISDTTVCIPDPLSLPISISRAYKIQDVMTDISVQLFQERIVISCSQLQGKIGSWVLCKPITNPHSINNVTHWDVTHLLGSGMSRDDPLLTVYSQRISMLLWNKMNEIVDTSTDGDGRHHHLYQQPSAILLGLSLKGDHSINTGSATNIQNQHYDSELFHTIVDLIVNVALEAVAMSNM